MKYDWADNPHLFIPVAVCCVVAVLGFAAAFVGLLSIILRQDFYGSIDEQNLPWSERWGNRNLRANAEFWSPRFQLARRAIAYGAMAFFCSFGAAALIMIIFGHPS